MAHLPVLPYTLLDVLGLGRGAEGDALHIHGRPPPARTCRPWPRRNLLVLRAAAGGFDADCWQRRVVGHGLGVLQRPAVPSRASPSAAWPFWWQYAT